MGALTVMAAALLVMMLALMLHDWHRRVVHERRNLLWGTDRWKRSVSSDSGYSGRHRPRG